MIQMPRRVAVFLTGIAGLFGMRTPPEPEVIAQMSPVKGPEGSGPEGFGAEDPVVQVALPGRRPANAAGSRRVMPKRRRAGRLEGPDDLRPEPRQDV